MVLVCSTMNRGIVSFARQVRFGLLLLQPFSCFLYPVASTAASESTISFGQEKDVTYLVLKRFYIIARLEKMCTSFFAMAKPDHTKLISFLPSFIQSAFTITPHPAIAVLADIFPLLQHEHVRSHIEVAYTTDSLEPVYTLWKELCAYRFLGDDLFIEEFSRILYILFQHCMEDNKNRKSLYKDVTNSRNPANTLAQSLTPSDALAIAQRFYLIQRLQYAVDLCAELYQASDEPAFTIMLSLWDDIQQYKNIDKINVSFGICTSILSLLDNAQIHRLTALTSETPVLRSSSHEITDNAALEKILEYIDAITDRYQKPL